MFDNALSGGIVEDTGERELLLLSCQRIVIGGLLLLNSLRASLSGYAGSAVNIVCASVCMQR